MGNRGGSAQIKMRFKFLTLLIALVSVKADASDYRHSHSQDPSNTAVFIPANYFREDNRQENARSPCDASPIDGVARIYVPAGGGQYRQGSANWVLFEGLKTQYPLFVTAAHNFYKSGRLRARVPGISVALYAVGQDGECEYKSYKIDKLFTVSRSPRNSYTNASNDIAVFSLKIDGLSQETHHPIHVKKEWRCDAASNLYVTSFVIEISDGVLPVYSSCTQQRKSFSTPYRSKNFALHDCETGHGSSGAMLYCEKQGIRVAHSIHVDGEGKSGEKFGRRNYNISLFLNGHKSWKNFRIFQRGALR